MAITGTTEMIILELKRSIAPKHLMVSLPWILQEEMLIIL